jgi:hypothetical protein
MAAANASTRGQRAATRASLAVDCVTPECRMLAVTELAEFCGRQHTIAGVLHRMRCGGGCGGRAAAAWLVTGILNNRVRPRRGGEVIRHLSLIRISSDKWHQCRPYEPFSDVQVEDGAAQMIFKRWELRPSFRRQAGIQ